MPRTPVGSEARTSPGGDTGSSSQQAQMLYFLRDAFLIVPLFILFYGVSALLLWRFDLALMAGVLIAAGSLPRRRCGSAVPRKTRWRSPRTSNG